MLVIHYCFNSFLQMDYWWYFKITSKIKHKRGWSPIATKPSIRSMSYLAPNTIPTSILGLTCTYKDMCVQMNHWILNRNLVFTLAFCAWEPNLVIYGIPWHANFWLSTFLDMLEMDQWHDTSYVSLSDFLS